MSGTRTGNSLVSREQQLFHRSVESFVYLSGQLVELAFERFIVFRPRLQLYVFDRHLQGEQSVTVYRLETLSGKIRGVFLRHHLSRLSYVVLFGGVISAYRHRVLPVTHPEPDFQLAIVAHKAGLYRIIRHRPYLLSEQGAHRSPARSC